jgi:hypothetical protein
MRQESVEWNRFSDQCRKALIEAQRICLLQNGRSLRPSHLAVAALTLCDLRGLKLSKAFPPEKVAWAEVILEENARMPFTEKSALVMVRATKIVAGPVHLIHLLRALHDEAPKDVELVFRAFGASGQA